ncbi:DUF4124 domain-containing protein [Atopomonas hussainii]|uniref:DUF4124 domain-containing protein n=1 Tax=Atopomonas hussainii TaxID=1429083 RepID=UPI000B2AD6BA|nr:DUF4124 domain-containing protein [Atopomonas hussainii]
MPRMTKTLLALALLPALASAEIYRWVDSEGRVHFGERPQGSGAQAVDVKPQVVENDAATRESQERMRQILKAREGERADQRQRQAETAAQNAQQQERCSELRGELENIARGGNFYRYDESGQRQYYSQEEIAAAKQRMQDNYQRYCQ